MRVAGGGWAGMLAVRRAGLRWPLAVAARALSGDARGGDEGHGRQHLDPVAARREARKAFDERRAQVLTKWRNTLPPAVELPPLGANFGHEEFAERLDQVLPDWFDVWETMTLAQIQNRAFNVADLVEESSFPGTPEALRKEKKALLPVIRERKLQKDGRAWGRGGRKRANASVWIHEGNGDFEINGKSIHHYFQEQAPRLRAIEPLEITGSAGKFNVKCEVQGGGLSGQGDAIRLGLARALQNWDPELRKILKPAGMLTRDARKVERKKPGLKKARKRRQWTKR